MKKRFYRQFSLRHLTIYRYEHLSSFSHSCQNRQREALCLANAGEASFEIGSQIFSLSPGELLYLPAGMPTCSHWRGDQIDYFTLDFSFTSKLVSHVPPTLDLSEETPYHLASAAFKVQDNVLNGLIRSVDEAFRTNAETGGLRAAISFHQLFNLLLEKALPTGSRIRPALDAIEADPSQSYSSKELAKLCSLSQSRFFALFSAETGMGPVRYRNQLRIEMALRLLRSNQYTVTEIAELLGFSSTDYFSRIFLSLTGRRPKDYQMQPDSFPL
ncbi:MAG TPA: AraC family transcriptional regulator [Candidatus Eisenbergiella merdipullorum]|uniref:AraC family transcriptional regulator n=1 Tax=Candidatus Eisenbergiella merdipullorum TaxID=2838553 RepID=A0A9D2I619_9FIRM|nr:AraC family transcriptional regulator [Candidatus Eisenbergiella merdipullorum]